MVLSAEEILHSLSMPQKPRTKTRMPTPLNYSLPACAIAQATGSHGIDMDICSAFSGDGKMPQMHWERS